MHTASRVHSNGLLVYRLFSVYWCLVRPLWRHYRHFRFILNNKQAMYTNSTNYNTARVLASQAEAIVVL